MLAPYQATVRVNSGLAAIAPHRAEAGIRVSRHQGNLLDPNPTFATIAGQNPEAHLAAAHRHDRAILSAPA